MKLLQRYVLFELLRIFLMVLTGLTVMLVFVGVVQEASKSGLGPWQIITILPFIIPSLLPFTIPATLLLTVCVVYGRMSGDQEITATKAAGINVMTLLWPSFVMGAVLSLCTFILTDQFIPWARANIERTVTLAMEDIFLDLLRTRNQVTDPVHGIAITVIRVDGKRLITPTFRYTPPQGNTVTIQAQSATMEFDLEHQQVVLHLERGHIETPGEVTVWFEKEVKPFPLPSHVEEARARNIPIRKIQEELGEIDQARDNLLQEKVMTTAFALSQGDFSKLSAQDDLHSQRLLATQEHRRARLLTEVHSRLALACSCFFFVLLGSPFSIMQARRQFLTNFFMCFMPILIVYYPIVMLMMNLGKNRMVNPLYGMWIGNAVLLVAAIHVIRKVMKH